MEIRVHLSEVEPNDLPITSLDALPHDLLSEIGTLKTLFSWEGSFLCLPATNPQGTK